jgi:hypothetical protein
MRKVLYFVFGFMLLAMPLSSAESFSDDVLPKLSIFSVVKQDLIEPAEQLVFAINFAITKEDTTLLETTIKQLDAEELLLLLLYTKVTIESSCLKQSLNLPIIGAITHFGLLQIAHTIFDAIPTQVEAKLFAKFDSLFFFAATLSGQQRIKNSSEMFQFLLTRVEALVAERHLLPAIYYYIICGHRNKTTLLHSILTQVR